MSLLHAHQSKPCRMFPHFPTTLASWIFMMATQKEIDQLWLISQFESHL